MDTEATLVHLSRLSIEGKSEDVVALVRRTLRPLMRSRPDLADQAKAILGNIEQRNVARANSSQPIPVDADSRLELLKRDLIVEFDVEPVWPEIVREELEGTIKERQRSEELLEAGLSPTRSLLFVGPPGVGKTLAAKWLAQHLERPLLTLDLAAVMSSFLGRTGNNIRVVLDYARRSSTVLLLDEFDAIAKRRDDSGEIGELKRLVTVLLQAIDEWPSDGLLIAATNHPELLDLAIWRRFDRVISFPQPSIEQIKQTVIGLVGLDLANDLLDEIQVFSLILEGKSFAEVVRCVNSARKVSLLENKELSVCLIETAKEFCKDLEKTRRLEISRKLKKLDFSVRAISEITGIARATLSKEFSNTQSRVVRNEKGRKNAT